MPIGLQRKGRWVRILWYSGVGPPEGIGNVLLADIMGVVGYDRASLCSSFFAVLIFQKHRRKKKKKLQY